MNRGYGSYRDFDSGRSGSRASSALLQQALRGPTEVEVWGDYRVPPDMAIHGMLLTVSHLLADPALRRASEAGVLAMEDPQATAIPLHQATQSAAMTPALRLLRPHIFSFLRLSFSHPSLNVNSVPFGLAVELWLLWMQPWKAPGVLQGHSPVNTSRQSVQIGPSGASARRGAQGQTGSSLLTSWWGLLQGFGSGRGSRGMATRGSEGQSAGAGGRHQSSDYSEAWQGWVLSNYSMYTTLLVAFLRKSLAMTFSLSREG
ncbi:unnamed protein product, partial [Discosporangium mesarthrocarpum]